MGGLGGDAPQPLKSARTCFAPLGGIFDCASGRCAGAVADFEMGACVPSPVHAVDGGGSGWGRDWCNHHKSQELTRPQTCVMLVFAGYSFHAQRKAHTLMSTLTLQLSNEPMITLPADLAQRAGFQAGADLQAVIIAGGLELVPADQAMGACAAAWPARRAQLRERAQSLGLYGPDRRDDEYWQIVAPLMEEFDREIY